MFIFYDVNGLLLAILKFGKFADMSEDSSLDMPFRHWPPARSWRFFCMPTFNLISKTS